MFYQRALQFFVIGLHPLRSTTPWRNHSLGDRFFRLGDHQLRINHQLRPQSVTRRTCTKMTVKGKMSRRSLAESEAAVGIAIVGGITPNFPARLWGQPDNLRFRWVGQNLIDDLLRRLADQRFSGHGIMRLTHGGEKNSQVIVNFSGRSDGRAGVRPGAALFDGNGRRQTLDEIDVGFFHLIKKLTGIGREALNVAALAFSIESIEGERGLSRSTQAGNDHQFLSRNLDTEILEIMLACSNDLDNLRRHSDDGCRTFKSSTRIDFLYRNRCAMSEKSGSISHEELKQLQAKYSEIKHSVNNALAVMMALSEMSQRRPDYAEKLASTVLTKAPQIVSSLQEFTEALNEKAGPKAEGLPKPVA